MPDEKETKIRYKILNFILGKEKAGKFTHDPSITRAINDGCKCGRS